MQALHASTSGRAMSYSRGAVAGGTSRRVCVRVQAAATTAGSKTVLAPPYNVLITGSTKGVMDAHSGLSSANTVQRLGCACRTTWCCCKEACMDISRLLPAATCVRYIAVSTVVSGLGVQVWGGPWQRTFWKQETMLSSAAEMVRGQRHVHSTLG